MSIANGKIWCARKHIQMLLKFHQVFVRTTDFVEPWNFARRAAQDEEMEESASHHVGTEGVLYTFTLISTRESQKLRICPQGKPTNIDLQLVIVISVATRRFE